MGDDDQNIYSFRGANVAHIHHFQDDYQAEVHFLVESYRSSGHIISAANALIAHNRDRLKTGRPIRVDARRRQDAAGGSWESLDPLTRGRVLVLEARDPESQAGALVERMRELRRLGDAQWSHFAVLARTRSALEPVRALCEAAGIPIAWPTDLPPAHRVREIAGFLDWLKGLGRTTLTAESLLGAYIRRMAIDVDCGNTQPRPSTGPLAPSTRGPSGERSQTPICDGSEECPIKKNPWEDIIRDLIRGWADEAGEAGVPANEIREFWYETLAEQRRDRTLGRGVLLATLHGAKGLEFPHVLIADDGWRADQRGEDERRLFYVGMTRARQTLTLGSVIGAGNPWIDEVGGDWLMRLHPQLAPPPREITARRYHLLSPAHLDLG